VAQKVRVSFVDDLDGSEAEGAVRFALDGTEYEIDLSAAHAAALREALGRYVEHARKAVNTAAGRRPGRAPRRPRQDATAVREWAKSQGLEVAERGRVSADVLAKYHEATGG
jgi:Lsr2